LAKTAEDAELLTQRILQEIPLADAMHFSIEQLNDHAIQARAPLADNVNVHGTGFAGSLYSVGALTAWALTTYMLEQTGHDADVVMAKAEIRYKQPVITDIVCQCELEAESREVFLKHLENRGRARLSLLVDIGEASEAMLSTTMMAIIK